MPIDIIRARAETPGCSHVLHFNNAGAGLMPAPVLEALQGHLELEARMGGYEAAEREEARLEHFYDAAATLLHCHRDELAFAENATRAWDMAFYSLPFEPGQRILTSVSEYASNYIAFLQMARRTGVRVEAVPNDEQGALSVPALENMLDDAVRLIAVTHIPTNGGLVNPAAEIGRVARAAGIPYLLDACQAAGQLPLDVEALGCDMLSVTGRKFLRGPRATGFLYVRKDFLEQLEPVFLDLHAAEWTAPDDFEIRPDARRFENWETHFAGKIALGVAIDYALDWGLEAIAEHTQSLAGTLRAGLEEIPSVTVRDLGAERCGIVTFTAEERDSEALKLALRERGINVSTCTRSGALLDMEGRGISDMVRASVHYYNDEEEVARFLVALGELV